MRWLRRRRRQADPDELLARRIAAAYALDAVSPLARYADGQHVEPTLLQEEIEWCRASPWVEEPHLRDLRWLGDYLDSV